MVVGFRARHVELDGAAHSVALSISATGQGVAQLAEATAVSVHVLAAGERPVVLVDGRVVSFSRVGYVRQLELVWASRRHSVRVGAAPNGPAANTSGVNGPVLAPMPGRIIEVLVQPGDAVAAGTPLAVIEAMKMQNEILSVRAARVERVLVEPGATVERGALLFELA